MSLLEATTRILKQFQQAASDNRDMFGSAYSPLPEREMDHILMFDDATCVARHFSGIEEARQLYALKKEEFVASLTPEQEEVYKAEMQRFGHEDYSVPDESANFPKGNAHFKAFAEECLNGKSFDGSNGFPLYDC